MQLHTRIAITTVIGLLAGGGCQYLDGNGAATEFDQPQYREIIVERGELRILVAANGIVRPIDRIELKSKASGEIIDLPVEIGDHVPQAGLIARLDQVEERAALAQAQADLDIATAELALAEKNFERRRKLYSSEIIPEEERDQTELSRAVARSKLVQARTALERANERMADSVVKAPVAGLILQKYVEKGQIITSGVSNVGGGTPIADIADMSQVHIEAGIDEIDIGKVAVGQAASVRAEAYSDNIYRGVIVRIAPEARIEQNVTLFDVVIRVDNVDGNLKSGMNAQVEIVIVERNDVVSIPVAALQQSPSDRGHGTVLLKAGGEYRAQEVRTGLTDYRIIEVLAGVAEGDVVGIPIVSRLKADNDRMENRMRSSRSFGNTQRSDDNTRRPTS